MKKIFKGLICAGLCGALAFGAAGCTKKGARDTESTPLRLAIGATDGKFNPLFYTAMNDGEIANMTQVSLITTNAQGNLAFGNDYPVVALDYMETYYSDAASTSAIGWGDGINVFGTSSKEGSTSYEFVIKNGIKFSDGHDLTVMDVLFNLYVYLDPAYSGSSTIYSTKIKGLQKYREQDPNADGSSSSSSLEYYADAVARADNIVKWSHDWTEGDDAQLKNGNELTELGEDVEEIRKRYKEQLESDWNSTVAGWVEAYKEYHFEEAWQAFYFVEGLVRDQTETDVTSQAKVRLKGSDGKYLTTLDPIDPRCVDEDRCDELIADMATATSNDKVDAYVASHDGVSRDDAVLALQKQQAIEQVYGNRSRSSQLYYILESTSTGDSILEYFMLLEMSKDKGAMIVDNIEGIEVYKSNKIVNKYTGTEKTYDEEHDILKITIDGIDPKAKWNFGVTVAPMHYYSDKEHCDAAMASYENGTVYTKAAKDFGVEYKDIKWINRTLATDAKNGLPVGAGAYKCCTHNYDDKNLDGGSFFYNNIAFYQRNEYFTTLGDGIENAKIKYITYKTTSDDKIMEALIANEIDFGTPSASRANYQRVQGEKHLASKDYLTGGYGYVGINPKYVPDIEVRRAIMSAFDTSWITTYYGTLANLITRPVSTTSWAYPRKPNGENLDSYYERITDPREIIRMIDNEGNWRYSGDIELLDGKFYSKDGGAPLKLTFTIAGESTDHPSYRMFTAAETFLEECGFEISVETDVRALQKLVTGDLAVWAAAWSSSIDPDPYQIYSINSNASSTNNWNKNGILREPGKYSTEYELALQINELIVAGRETLNGGNSESERAKIYAQCYELIMEMAVEFPAYQRRDLCVYNPSVLDASTMHIDDASWLMSPLGEIWKVNYKN